MPALGILCKLYRNSATREAPTWVEVPEIADFSEDPAWDEADANSRESRVKASVKTLLGLTFTGNIKNKPGNANYEAFMDALHSDDALDLLIMKDDKDTVGTRGWRVECQVFQGTNDQGLNTRLYTALTLKPTDSDNPPLAVKVAAGPTLTYATPGADGATFA